MVQPPRGTTLVEALVALLVAALVALPAVQAAGRAVADTDASADRRRVRHAIEARAADALLRGCTATSPPIGTERVDSLVAGGVRLVRRWRVSRGASTLQVVAEGTTARGMIVRAERSVACG